MPLYLMECQSCSFQWDGFFTINAKKEGKCSECGGDGKRIFTVPNVGIDTKVNPTDIDGLVKKTGNMKGTLGDLYDLAAETSQKRGGDNDPIKKKALADYAKLRKGKQYKDPKKKKDGFSVAIKPK